MKIKEIISSLEVLAPPILQESYDNAGLITGDANDECTGVLVCLDSIEEVVQEAIQKNCNLIVAHHPIVFSGIKKFSGNSYVLRTIRAAIRNNISIYAIHTNLDNVYQGVNAAIAEKLALRDTRILVPKRSLLRKLVTYCPVADAPAIRNALFEAGAGNIGKYDSCSFNLEGDGTFRAQAGADPYVGRVGELHVEKETRIEVVVPEWKAQAVETALMQAHPYEEVAFYWEPLLNNYQYAGSGMIGTLDQPVDTMEFLRQIKNTFGGMLRHTKLITGKIQTVALCGGSGSFLLQDAILQKADLFLSADFKYHQFFDADEKIIIADIGHFESEQFTMSHIHSYLLEKFPNFAVLLTSIQTNPVHYI